MTGLDKLLDEIAHRVAGIVVERLHAGSPGMIDQSASPLGSRRHCAAVRRRIARGEGGAAIVGRRHLLSAEALAEQLGRVSEDVRAAKTPSASGGSVRSELERELRLVRGGGRHG